MKIGILSKPYLPIPSRAYGAIEKLVYYLVCELSKKKEDNYYLFAPGDSQNIEGVQLESLFKEGVGGRINNEQVELLQALHCLERSKELNLDVIHAHSVDPILAFSSSVEIPILFSFHTFPNEINKYLSRRADHLHYTFVSESHRQQFPWLKKTHVVYPGINPDNFPFCDNKDKYLAFVGSVCPEKGIMEAIDIAQVSGKSLKIAAKVQPGNEEFFQKQFLPAVENNKKIEFLGELKEVERNELLKRAECLLFPIKWDEPFGLVQLESLVVGTPVIGFNRGAVSEVIEDGKNGFIVNNVEEAVSVLDKITTISPQNCRKTVTEKFSSIISTRHYMEIYKNIVKS
jgi:glycosyltransferase involved in cell wall biosynthesis